MDDSIRPSVPSPPLATPTDKVDADFIRQILSKAFYGPLPNGMAEKREFTRQWSQLLTKIVSTPAFHADVIKWFADGLRSKSADLTSGLNRNQGMAISILRFLEQRVSVSLGFLLDVGGGQQ